MDYLTYRLSELSDCVLPHVLDEQEEALAARRGGQFRTVRTLLKTELSRRCGIAAQDIRFTYGKHGKPQFEHMRFNISHSKDCLCMAFHHSDIGVDVEMIRPRPMRALAQRFMAEPQLESFLKRGCRGEEFFSCWCAAEALVKQAGDSIWNVSAYPFLYEDGCITPLFDGAPSVQLFCPLPGYVGAIAYHHAPSNAQARPGGA